ncbi:MAG: DoxX family protein [Carbonactinosporaceae bacterium]
MRLVRGVARPMLAAVFIADGLDSLRRPKARVGAVERLGPAAARRLRLPENPETLVRVNGAAQVVCGLLLATSRSPRLASLALAATLVPATAGAHPFWEAPSGEERRNQLAHFLKNVGLCGGLLIAAVDTQGQPSVGWWARRAAHTAGEKAGAARERARDVLPD